MNGDKSGEDELMDALSQLRSELMDLVSGLQALGAVELDVPSALVQKVSGSTAPKQALDAVELFMNQARLPVGKTVH